MRALGLVCSVRALVVGIFETSSILPNDPVDDGDDGIARRFGRVQAVLDFDLEG